MDYKDVDESLEYTFDEVISGMVDNVSEDEIDRQLADFAKYSRALKSKVDDLIFVALDDYEDSDPQYNAEVTKVRDIGSGQLYNYKGANFIREEGNGVVWIIVGSDGDLNIIRESFAVNEASIVNYSMRNYKKDDKAQEIEDKIKDSLESAAGDNYTVRPDQVRKVGSDLMLSFLMVKKNKKDKTENIWVGAFVKDDGTGKYIMREQGYMGKILVSGEFSKDGREEVIADAVGGII